MAPKSLGGVVDPHLKVYGTANVRVIDASIFPMTVGATTQATVYAVAEKVRGFHSSPSVRMLKIWVWVGCLDYKDCL